MTDQPPRPRRNGLIGGEPMPFVSSSIDEATGAVRISVVQRGSRTVERVQAMMARELVTLQLPDREQPVQAVPKGLDVTTSGSGGRTLYRMDLRFELPADEATPASDDTDARPDSALTSPAHAEGDPGIADRLGRIEAKLDRILDLLQDGNGRTNRQ